jgi:hypothetical protein
MNSARTLADRFRTQRTDRIRVDGVEVLSIAEFSIEHDAAVEVMIEQSRGDIEQSLHVRAKRAELTVLEHAAAEDDEYDFDPSIVSDSVTLIADQLRRIEFAIATEPDAEDSDEAALSQEPLSPKPITLQIWNSWLLGDAEHAWIGNSGMVVEELSVPDDAAARMRLWCSDGLGDPQFDDLVVVVTIGPRVETNKLP